VVLSDDHAPMRSSLRRVLDGEDGVEVVGEADDLASVAREVREHRPHVLVLDLGMQNGSSAIEAIGALREGAPTMTIVALTMKDDPGFAQHALAAGAVGFVSKELADAELGEAVRAAARGERFVSERVAARLRTRRGVAMGKRGESIVPGAVGQAAD
jgi:DNA-binding NarL/FixJ family response regulator